jgi:toluene monooxygenase system protein B
MPVTEPQTSGALSAVPVNARFDDDFVTRLTMVLPSDTLGEVARKVAAPVVGRRVPNRDAGMAVRHLGRVLPAEMTVAEAGIKPFQSIFVGWASEDSP